MGVTGWVNIISICLYGVAVIMFFMEIKAFIGSLGSNPFSMQTLTNGVILFLDFGIMGIIAKANALMGGIPTISGLPSAFASVLASIWMYLHRKRFERHIKEAEEKARLDAIGKSPLKRIAAKAKAVAHAYRMAKNGKNTD